MAITLNVCAKDESGTRVSLDNNSVCESTCFQLSGTAEPGKTVKLYDNGEYIGLSQADADGNWQYEAKGLKCGSHEFVAQTYTAGVGPGQSSESFSVVISPSENDPAEVQVQLPDGTTIFDGGVRDTAQPRISGYGQPGATVKISADGETYGPVEIDGDGQWAVDITKPLPQGEVVLAAQAESASGQRAYFGLKLDINTVALEAEAASARSVDAPTIDSVEDNVGTRQGQLLDNAHTDDDIPLLRGSADAFAQVEVYDNGTLIGDVFADASGNWRWSPSTALPEGSHRFSAVAIDLDGNRSDESQSFTIIVDRTAEQVTDFRAVDDVGAVTGIIGQGQITDDPRPSIRGGGVPGASVEIFDNGVSIGTVTVDANGEWELSTDMADGEHRLVAYHTDQAANTGPASEELRFTVLTSQPEPVESVAILDGGDEHLSTAELSQNVGVQIKLKDNIDVGDIVEVDVNGDGVADGSHVVGQADIGGFIQVDIAGSEYAIGDDKSVTATAVVVDGNGLRSDGVSDSSTTGLFGVAAISGYTQNNALYYQHINYYRSGDYHLIISERFDAGAVVLNVSQLVNNGSEQLVLRLGGLSDDWRIQDSSGKVAQVVNGVADISGFNLNAALNLYTDNNTYYTTTPVAPGDHTSTYQSWYGNQRDFTLTLEAQTRDPISGELSDIKTASFGFQYSQEVYQGFSPLVLDLDGDGVETISLAEGVSFDLDADGSSDITGWAAPDDGLLVRDLNGDGIINDGSELFGESTLDANGQRADNGFMALSYMDSNGDGLIDSADTDFGQLQIWRDLNSDGNTQTGELFSLSQVGVASINLAAEAVDEINNQNFIGLRSSWTDDEGAEHRLDDVWFSYEPGQDESIDQDEDCDQGFELDTVGSDTWDWHGDPDFNRPDDEVLKLDDLFESAEGIMAWTNESLPEHCRAETAYDNMSALGGGVYSFEPPLPMPEYDPASLIV